MMKKRNTLLAVLTLSALCLTGCGFVKVVPIGQEGEYTGKVTFDSQAESSNDWSAVAEDITAKAVDLSELLSGDGLAADGSAVSGKATIIEFNTETPKYYLAIEVDGYDGEVRIQAGGVYSGTTVRDVQSLKVFQDFTNQTEWSQYAKALNKEVDAQVVAPLALDESAAGKTVEFVGAAAESNGRIVITPVSMTIE